MLVGDHPALHADLRTLIDFDLALLGLQEVGRGKVAYAKHGTLRPNTVVTDLIMETAAARAGYDSTPGGTHVAA
jgi:hypothetical protein